MNNNNNEKIYEDNIEDNQKDHLDEIHKSNNEEYQTDNKKDEFDREYELYFQEYRQLIWVYTKNITSYLKRYINLFKMMNTLILHHCYVVYV